MSKFFSKRLSTLTPYTPGEQPKVMNLIKLNTNESPFPPSPKVDQLVQEAAKNLQLYSNIPCTALSEEAARLFNISPDEILFTNGSDEILNFAFQAFCDDETPAVFADITYGFYSVFAEVNALPYKIIPLRDDFTLNIDDYMDVKGKIFIPNTNATTGITLPVSEIERLLQADPNRVVVVDEAYADFSHVTCVPLIHKYPNLLVTQTFSKSRSLAGARLGFGIAGKTLMQDLNTIKYSTNPYNVNSLTQAAGLGALQDEAYTKANCEKVIETRTYVTEELVKLGFTVLPSGTNFVFASTPKISGLALYEGLKQRNILIRHFETDRLKDYNRITIGSRAQMEIFLSAVKEILEENA